MKKILLTIAIVIMTIPLYGQIINVGELNRLLSAWPYSMAISGTLDINGKITTDITETVSTTEFYFLSTTSATSGTQNNIRARVQATAASGATGEDRAIYAQAVTNASLFGGTLTGVFANWIGKNASTTVNGRALFAEAETEATATAVTNMYAGYFRTKAHLDPTSDYYTIMLDNEKVATGFLTDAYIGMKSTTWGAGASSATYGIDMNGIQGVATADVRMVNGATLYNSSASLLTITEATVDVVGAFTASTVTSDAAVAGTELNVGGNAVIAQVDTIQTGGGTDRWVAITINGVKFFAIADTTLTVN